MYKMRFLRSLQEKKMHFISLWDLFLTLITQTFEFFWWPVAKKSLPLVTKLSLGQFPLKHEGKNPTKSYTVFKYKCPNSSCLQADILLSQISLFNIEVLAGPYEINEAKFLTGNTSDHTSQLLGLKRLSGCALQTWHRHSLISWHS